MRDADHAALQFPRKATYAARPEKKVQTLLHVKLGDKGGFTNNPAIVETCEAGDQVGGRFDSRFLAK